MLSPHHVVSWASGFLAHLPAHFVALGGSVSDHLCDRADRATSQKDCEAWAIYGNTGFHWAVAGVEWGLERLGG